MYQRLMSLFDQCPRSLRFIFSNIGCKAANPTDAKFCSSFTERSNMPPGKCFDGRIAQAYVSDERYRTVCPLVTVFLSAICTELHPQC